MYISVNLLNHGTELFPSLLMVNDTVFSQCWPPCVVLSNYYYDDCRSYLFVFLVCQVKNNISKVFTRFIQEGKATIKFKEPAHDLAISKVYIHTCACVCACVCTYICTCACTFLYMCLSVEVQLISDLLSLSGYIMLTRTHPIPGNSFKVWLLGECNKYMYTYVQK